MAPGFRTTSEASSHARLSILTPVTSPRKPIHGPVIVRCSTSVSPVIPAQSQGAGGVGSKPRRHPPSGLMKGSRVRCSPLKAYLSIRNSPIRNDQAIEADLLRGELNSREAGTFRNAFELGESINVATRCSGQHHHAEGRRGGRRNAIRIGNEFSNCGAAAWV